MAEAVVSMVVERLGNLLIEEAKFIHGVGDQIRDIRDELWWTQSFLKDADARQYKDHRVRTWVREIKEIAYDAGDVLESYLFKVESRKRGGIINVLKRYACIVNEGVIRHKVGSEIQAIETRISKLTTRLQTYGIRSLSEDQEGSGLSIQRESQLRLSYSHVGQDDFVGLQEDLKRLVASLVDDKEPRVVSIWGMGGLGKTTLARKVYNHEKVKRHFDLSAWICVSQKWQTRDLFQQILTKLIPEERDKIVKLRNDELTEKLFHVQEEKKCLIVLDDIWYENTWDSLKDAFPNESMKGKLLLTSRNKEVSNYVNSANFIYNPPTLGEDECWELLKKKAFTNMALSDNHDLKEKEKLGREMITQCGGLPLAVVVLGGILVTKSSLREWRKVQQNIKSYLRSGEGMHQHDNGVLEILTSSYNDLPYQLKPCFLYLGKFAEDFEIEADQLYQLWMAESMVLSEDRKEGETMIDVAERYLGEMAQRSMVQVQLEENVYGLRKFKSCRLHDLMRVLCLSKAKEEDFFNVIDLHPKNDDEHVDPSSSLSNKSRRVVIVSEGPDTSLRNISFNNETRQHMRSMLFFNERSYTRPLQRAVRSLVDEFKMLRVLAIENLFVDDDDDNMESVIGYAKLIFDHFALSKALGNLVHLRYLSFRDSSFLRFPSFLENLNHLQTLDLRGTLTSYFPCMRDALRKMIRLRHLYLPSPQIEKVQVSKLRLDGFSNLETLENCDPCWCESKDLSKLINLRKLTVEVMKQDLEGLEGVIRYLMSTTAKHTRYFSLLITGCDFVQEKWHEILMELLGCGSLHELYIRSLIGDKLPAFYNDFNFSSSLTKLTLVYPGLEEDPMPTLERLPNLHSLFLYGAFSGKVMVCSSNGFPQLISLELWDCPQLEEWRVEQGALHNLSSLRLRYLPSMKMVPDGLRFISTLRELKIHDFVTEFTQMVQAVLDGDKGEDFERIGHVDSISIEIKKAFAGLRELKNRLESNKNKGRTRA
ncbi:hypothetical protein LguiA_030606 [Lonicera macranthoides]